MTPSSSSALARSLVTTRLHYAEAATQCPINLDFDEAEEAVRGLVAIIGACVKVLADERGYEPVEMWRRLCLVLDDEGEDEPEDSSA